MNAVVEWPLGITYQPMKLRFIPRIKEKECMERGSVLELVVEAGNGQVVRNPHPVATKVHPSATRITFKQANAHLSLSGLNLVFYA